MMVTITIFFILSFKRVLILENILIIAIANAFCMIPLILIQWESARSYPEVTQIPQLVSTME
jgi:hypothetical protein